MIQKINRTPSPPKFLSKESKKLWKEYCSRYDFECHAFKILEIALSCYDRVLEARKILNSEGVTCEDRWGVVKQHPAVAIELKYERLMIDSMGKLNLDVEPLRETPGRPPLDGFRF